MTLLFLILIQTVAAAEVVKLLQSGEWRDRERALVAVESSPALRSDVVIREAMIRELKRTIREFDVDPDHSLGEYKLALVRVMREFKDPAAIPALTWVVNTSLATQEALSAFGPKAIPAIQHTWNELRRTKPLPEHYASLPAALIATLTEIVRGHLLPAVARDWLVDITRTLLSENEGEFLLKNAIDLALLLDDPHLLADVGRLAGNIENVMAVGVSDKEAAAAVQEHAIDALQQRVVPPPFNAVDHGGVVAYVADPRIPIPRRASVPYRGIIHVEPTMFAPAVARFLTFRVNVPTIPQTWLRNLLISLKRWVQKSTEPGGVVFAGPTSPLASKNFSLPAATNVPVQDVLEEALRAHGAAAWSVEPYGDHAVKLTFYTYDGWSSSHYIAVQQGRAK